MIDFGFTKESRLDLIQLAIKKTKAKSYLEIGCDRNQIFSNINVRHKIGVDPARGGTHRMTSNDFFKNNKEHFDVIFIDGLHYYDQVKLDVENGLSCLNNNGIIVIHDMLPIKESHAVVPIPEPFTKPWLGDVWRLGFELMTRTDVVFHIVKIDSGCGILWRGTQTPVNLSATSDWKFYEENCKKMPLISFDDLSNLL